MLNNKLLNVVALISFAAAPAFVLSSVAIAQTKNNAPIVWHGYVDTYFQDSPQAHYPSSGTGPSYLDGRVFDNLNDQVVLNMVQLSATRNSGPIGFEIDLAYGQMVDALAGSGTLDNGQPAAVDSQEPTRNITQAFVTYTPEKLPNLTIKAGKFYSLFGYETTLAKDNWQYSRSLSFNFAIPYWSEGVSAQYMILPDKLSATIQLINGWDGRISAKTNNSPTICLSLGATPTEKLALNYNFLGGNETGVSGDVRELNEVNAAYTFNGQFALAADYVNGYQKHALADMSAASWNALDFYFKYAPTSWYTLSPRYEIFDDSDKGFALSGFDTAGGVRQKVTSFTLSNDLNVGNGLNLRAEYRTDQSNQNGFFKNKAGQSTNRQDSYTVAMLYAF